MSLAVRSAAIELMDADDLDPATYGAVIGDLARLGQAREAALAGTRPPRVAPMGHGGRPRPAWLLPLLVC